jgi:hypothetical protein
MENAPTVKSAKTKLLIAASYYAPAIGGLERYASEMAKVAHQANYEVVVVCSGKGASVTQESSDGIRIYRSHAVHALKHSREPPLALDDQGDHRG